MADPDLTRPGIPWPRVFAEGLVIVAGILLALAVDAAWEARQERHEEREVLRYLAEEFEANEEQLGTKMDWHHQALDASEALLEYTGTENRWVPPRDSLSTLIYDFLGTPTFDPVDGVLNSVIASGALDIITNDDLRIALAGWPSLVKDLNEDEEAAWREVDQRYLPFIEGRAALRSLHLSKDRDLFQRTSDFEVGTSELLRDRGFENLVVQRIFRVNTILIPLEAVEVGLREIQDLLELELGL